jgi:hypothetical protein
MERELEFLRQQVEYLERMLENCMAHLSTLEARVAELERRPVVVSVSELPAKERVPRLSQIEVLEWGERYQSVTPVPEDLALSFLPGRPKPGGRC